MPPKQSRASKKSKIEQSIDTPLKSYLLINLEQQNVWELKHKLRIHEITTVINLIEDAFDTVKVTKNAQEIIDEWETYLRCDGLPYPYRPGEIRTFFVKTLHFEKENVDKTINWMLSVDERSILNQDVEAVNLTKNILMESRPNFGEHYADSVSSALKVIKSIEDFLDNPIKTKKCSDTVLRDIKELKFKSSKHIQDYFDQLTFRVLCSVDGYMKPIDIISAEYTYSVESFTIHIWALKDVPIRFFEDEIPSLDVNFHQISVRILLPFSVLDENIVIRGIHCDFDHFSEPMNSFRLQHVKGIMGENENLRTCLDAEWQRQNDIQKEVRAKMIVKRIQYEEYMQSKAEEIAQQEKERKKAQNDKTNDKGKKQPKKKGPKEPPIITSDTFPDVMDDFLEEDQSRYEELMRTQMHPDCLKLDAGEINLRNFQILGGIYQLDFVKKPQSVNYASLIMTWYECEGKLKHEDVKCGLQSEDRKDGSNVQTNSLHKFFVITFKLPASLCHWGEPVPCYFDCGYGGTVTNEDSSISNLKTYTPLIINDFNINGVLSKPQLYDLVCQSIPHTISSFRFPQELLEEAEQNDPKGAGLLKKVAKEDKSAENEENYRFSFKAQTNPERLFPLFSKIQPVVILPAKSDGEDKQLIPNSTNASSPNPYNKFSDLLSAFKDIKDCYGKSQFVDVGGNFVDILKMVKSKTTTGTRFTVSRKTRSVSEHMGQGQRKTERLSTWKHKKASKQSIFREDKKSQIQLQPNIETDKETVIDKDADYRPPKWTVNSIYHKEFNRDNQEITIWTDRLGSFGFAFNRYQHFPFRMWSLEPSDENPNYEALLKIESFYAKFQIYISRDGYRAMVTDFTRGLKSRKKFLVIDKPIKKIKELKKKFQEKHLNIFADCDATFYISDGICTEKHFTVESHTYTCMSLHCMSMKFVRSEWNRLSNRRFLLFNYRRLKDVSEDLNLVRISPEDVIFVECKELCSEDLDKFNIEYTPTWRNIEYYADLNHLITLSHPGSSDEIVKDATFLYNLRNLLCEIRPLSFA